MKGSGQKYVSKGNDSVYAIEDGEHRHVNMN